MAHKHHIHLIFFFDEREFRIETTNHSPLYDAVGKVLDESGEKNKLPREWIVRERDGEELDQALSPEELGLKDGSVLTLTPKAEPQEIKINFIINGQDFKVKSKRDLPLSVAVEKALVESANTGRAPSEWEVRNVDGVLLDQSLTLVELKLKYGVKLFLSLKVGAGGID